MFFLVISADRDDATPALSRSKTSSITFAGRSLTFSGFHT
jgi:hypothetical protein